ncbi:MAG: hypothetical protein H0U67_12200, partial [Gemmatimonadetes bacterium]|nr:hypothetical protein [Gemmatimonadota bacterium]
IWVVIAILALEGIGNFMRIPRQPEALGWFLAKVLLITGLLLRWRPVYILALLLTAIHVVFFAAAGSPIVAILNLVLLGLVARTWYFYFPETGSLPSGADREMAAANTEGQRARRSPNRLLLLGGGAVALAVGFALLLGLARPDILKRSVAMGSTTRKQNPTMPMTAQERIAAKKMAVAQASARNSKGSAPENDNRPDVRAFSSGVRATFFVAYHHAKQGNEVLNAARDFVQEHTWDLKGESGTTSRTASGVTERVVLKAADPAGKPITFELAYSGGEPACFTISAEAGAELPADRIGSAIWHRLGWAHRTSPEEL